MKHSNERIVAEPIALKLRRETGNIYLDAQIFVGFMFVGAALCTWKIDQVEQEAAKRRQRDEGGLPPRVIESTLGRMRLAMNRLVVWKRV